jgi:hypothetical protein
MRPSRAFVQAIVLVVAGTYLVVYAINGWPTGDLLEPLGAATSAAGLFVLAFDHFLWRLPKIGFRISKRPDLRGTWRGTLASHWISPETNERIPPDPEVYMVIRQTYWSVTATQITKESKSCSTTAVIEDDGCEQYELVALYRNTPRAAVRERSQVHHGSFKLDIGGRPPSRLEGYYWTDRNTIGELEFHVRDRRIVDTYTEAQGLGLPPRPQQPGT